MKRLRGMIPVALLAMSICLSGCGDLEDALMKELEAAMMQEIENAMGEDDGAQMETAETEDDDTLFEEDDTLFAEEDDILFQEEISPPADDTPAYREVDGIFTVYAAAEEESSSAGKDYSGSNAVDGTSDTCWVTAEGDSEGSWIKVNFKEPFTISEVLVEHGFDGDYYGHGRIETMDLIFDDGTKAEIICKYEDMNTFSQEIVPKTTSSVLVQINSVYPGETYDDLAIRELTFLYNPNNSFSGLEGADEPVMGSGQKEASGGGNGKSKDPGADAYVREGWDWQGTGYGDQDYDGGNFTVGKWISEDGNTVLYVDFESSPDYMDYGLYHKGVITEHYALMHWELNIDTGFDEAKDAYDEDNNIYFEVTGEGEMFILYGDETLYMKLKRAKY